MPRPKSPAPAYQFHVSGQAVVRLDYQDFYLGKHGTPESYSRYYGLLAEYNANGKKAPQFDAVQSVHLADTAIQVKQITADFRARKLPTYEGNHGEYNRYDNLLKLLNERYGDEPAEEFGPRKLESLRDHILKHGIGERKDQAVCRRYTNTLTQMVINIIRYGVSRELVSATVIEGLKCLDPLRHGEAKDNPKRQPAELKDVKATMPYLCSEVSAMVRIQLATAMRPSEIFRMRPCDLDSSGEVLFYRPSDHKTAHHGQVKSVPILGDALEALTPYLDREPDQLCFVTNLSTPWNKDNYRRHITRACGRAGVKWTPYELRHRALQTVRDVAGPEAAQALAGHSRLDMTEHYAKASEAKAIEAAKNAPRLN